jgi:gluconokinase
VTPAVIIMGVSGSGKSTLAQALATQLRVPFLEGDEFHSAGNRRKMSAGIALDDEDRWPWLDALGMAIADAAGVAGVAGVAGAAGAADAPRGVVATCSALKRSYRDRLRRAVGRRVGFICLVVEHDALVQRLESRKGHYMPATLLASQVDTLEMPGVDEPDAVSIASADVPGTLERALRVVAGWSGEFAARGPGQGLAPGSGSGPASGSGAGPGSGPRSG